MGTVKETVKFVFLRDSATAVVYECRRCGTSVESADSSCSKCDCDDVVEYTIQ